MKNRKNIFFKMLKGIRKNTNVHKYRYFVKAFRKFQRCLETYKRKSIGHRAIQVAKATLLVSKRVSLATKLSRPSD
jgi:hypothetical protein